MKIRLLAVELTPKELEESAVLQRFLGSGGEVELISPQVVSNEAQLGDAPDVQMADSSDLIPGVAPEGQAVVRDLLKRNPHADLVRQFLAEASSWPGVGVHGIKRRNQPSDAPLDYGHYLRLRCQPSPFGGFAYTFPATGRVELRLSYTTDEELEAVSREARRLHAKSAYGVEIHITTAAALTEALRLAELSYRNTIA